MGQIGLSSGFAQQGSYGPGNWELVIPWPDGGFAAFYRDDSGWHGPLVVTPPASPVVRSLAFMEGDYQSESNGDHQNFELIAVEGGKLVHWWRDNAEPFAWHRGAELPGITTAGGVTLGRSHWGVPPKQTHPVHEAMLVTAQLSGGGVLSFEMPRQIGNNPPPLVWTQAGTVDYPEQLFEGLGWAFGAVGSTDPDWDESTRYASFVSAIRLAVRSDGNLLSYEWFHDGTGQQMNENPGYVGTGVRGRPAVLESDRGYNRSWPGSAQWHHGHYEAFAPAAGGGVTHFWRANEDGIGEAWNLGATVGRLVYDEVSAFQSRDEEKNLNDSTAPLQVFARIDGERWVHHFTHRDLESGFEWRGPFKIGFKPPAAGLLPGSPVGLGRGNRDAVALAVAADGSVQATYRTQSGWEPLDTVSPAGTALPGTPVKLINRSEQATFSAGQMYAVLSGGDGSVRLMVMSAAGSWTEASELAPAGATVPGAAVEIELQGAWTGWTNVVYAGADGSVKVHWVGKDDAYVWHGPGEIAPPGTVHAGARVSLHLQTLHQLDAVYVPEDGSVQVRWVDEDGGQWKGPAVIAPPGSAVPGSRVALAQQGERDQLDAIYVAPNGSLQLIWVSGRESWQGPSELAPPGSVTEETVVSMTPRTQIDQVNAMYVAADGSIQVAWTTKTEPWRPFGPVAPPGTARAGSELGLLTQGRAITMAYVAPDNSLQELVINQDGWVGPMQIAAAFPAATYGGVQTLLTLANTAAARPDRALAAIHSFEATAAARDLAALNPAYRSSLGEWLLYPIQAYISAAGKTAEAISAATEALDVFRRLRDEDPADLRLGYQQARALVTLATRLADVPDAAGASARALEGAGLARQVAVADPVYRDAFGQWLIWPIQVYVAGAGDRRTALALATEALGIFEALEQEQSGKLDHVYHHANALVQVAVRLWDVDDRAGAVVRAGEAARVAARLTAASTAYLPSQGDWLLWPIVPFLRSAGSHADAVAAADEAVAVFEKLSADAPTKYAEKLAAARALRAGLG
ncbi:hypothetical protein [Kribbella sp. NPDC000426]|uniref:hypothetical protein n=1 Tax=Kribbella sp. NPDC000426 TaxID=3154255 RepID=UPI00332FDEAF